MWKIRKQQISKKCNLIFTTKTNSSHSIEEPGRHLLIIPVFSILQNHPKTPLKIKIHYIDYMAIIINYTNTNKHYNNLRNKLKLPVSSRDRMNSRRKSLHWILRRKKLNWNHFRREHDLPVAIIFTDIQSKKLSKKTPPPLPIQTHTS